MKERKQAKKVIVSGCFDVLHSGHVAFLEEAAQYGDLYVCLGSDKTILSLKNKYPVNTERERLYMVQRLKSVHAARISKGSGYLDFLPELNEISPDIFIVNTDGHSIEKEKLCREKNIEYIVLNRVPADGLPKRSSTEIKQSSNIPFRIDLAGGWLDQPFVSKFAKGAVITICLEPSHLYIDRGGMASSTRNVAIQLWNNEIPEENSEKIAQILFAVENPPGKKEIAGSQDAIGIIFTGLNRSIYNGEYWPYEIKHHSDEEILSFIETYTYLIPLGPRQSSYDVLAETYVSEKHAQLLSMASAECWNALMHKDYKAYAHALTAAFEAQIAMFPNMVNSEILEQIRRYSAYADGWKISGAGGGGYLILISQKPLPEMLSIKIRRPKSK